MRHGCVANIHIIIKYTINAVNLYVIDNGINCQQIIKGFGLRGMEERIKSHTGEIYYSSSDERDFNIHSIIPIEDNVLWLRL